MLHNFFKKYIVEYPKLIISSIVFISLVLVNFALSLEIDVSADTLLLEGDKDLAYSKVVSKRFNSSSFLVLTYSIKDDLLNKKNIDNIKILTNKFILLDNVLSVGSIVNVALLQSPVKPISELFENITTLESKNIDKSLVKLEFLNSPIYANNLVSKDFKTTALSINIVSNLPKETYHDLILSIKDVMTDFTSTHNDVELHLAGVEMISDDMVEYIKSDLFTFGFLIVGLLFIILFYLLKSLDWVFIAISICSASLIITSGLISLFAFKITVVSSNFISLQLIMNMSLVVHLIIKYKELYENNIKFTQKELVLKTISTMSTPSFFVIATSIAGFSSLVMSGILPVIVFGWMMSLGLVVSLIITFLMFPSLVLLVGKKQFKEALNDNTSFMKSVAKYANTHKKIILTLSLMAVLSTLYGVSKLRVENSFIDYFKKDTDTYKGMYLLDNELGGTIPLDIILTFKEKKEGAVLEDDDGFDEFEEEFLQDDDDKELYWFTTQKMLTIQKVHQYLAAKEEIGKVISLFTIDEILSILNNNKAPDSLMLNLIKKELPDKYKEVVLSPYLNIEHNQVRISARVIDSKPELKRDEFIKQIRTDLDELLNESYVDYRVSGLLLMYNNMLQSLFNSQIKTIGVVIFMLFSMFLILFKSFKIALMAMLVNIVPVSMIFGFMGIANIPLDMMTITIASIGIGIAVDNTIHYIYRYRLEYKKTKDLKQSVINSHSSIGIAMFYTSIVIMVGFSVLVFSNFIPTIYFGLLTMLAMFMAILSNLFLLPVLLVSFYKEKEIKG